MFLHKTTSELCMPPWLIIIGFPDIAEVDYFQPEREQMHVGCVGTAENKGE